MAAGRALLLAMLLIAAVVLSGVQRPDHQQRRALFRLIRQGRELVHELGQKGCTPSEWDFPFEESLENMIEELEQRVEDLSDQLDVCLQAETVSSAGVTSAEEPEEVTSAEEPEEVTSVEEPEEATSAEEPEEATSAEEPEEVTSAEEPEEVTSVEEPEEATSAEEPEEATSAEEPEEATSTESESGED